ncbi:MAG: hypothetical protein ACTSPL_04115 [Candidatus Odinarchaeia archaeon]
MDERLEKLIKRYNVDWNEVEAFAKSHNLSIMPPMVKIASYLKERGRKIPTFMAQYDERMEVPVSMLEVGVSAYVRVYIASDINKVSWNGCPICFKKIPRGSITCDQHPDTEGVELTVVSYLAGDASGSIPVDIPSWTPIALTGKAIGLTDLCGKTIVAFGYLLLNGNFRVRGIVEIIDGVAINADDGGKIPVTTIGSGAEKAISMTEIGMVAQPKEVKEETKVKQSVKKEDEVVEQKESETTLDGSAKRFLKMLSILNAGLGEKEIEAWMQRNNVKEDVQKFIAKLGDRVEKREDGLYWLVGDYND